MSSRTLKLTITYFFKTGVLQHARSTEGVYEIAISGATDSVG